MKVLHVFGAMDVGGAELRTMDLQRELAPSGVTFHYLTLSGREGVLADEIRQMGGDVHPLGLNPWFPAKYVRLLRDMRPGVVDSHVATFSGALLVLAWVARVPVRIAHFRSDADGHEASFRRRMQRTVMRALIKRFATDIVGVSPSALSDGYDPRWQTDPRARVVVNGFSTFTSSSGSTHLREELGVPEATLLLHVGRPSPEKNRVLTVRILRELVDAGHDVHLALAGGVGADTEALHQLARDLAVEDRLHDLGQRRDARDLMSQADVVLLTSIREGLPGVVIEALSTGTPVVATALPGVLFISSRLPGVQAVDLASPLSDWAAAIGRSVHEAADLGYRQRIAAEFESSTFAQARASAEHFQLYRGRHADS